MRRVLALAAALSAAAAAVSAAPITPEQHERDTAAQRQSDASAAAPDIDITGLRLGMTAEQVEAALAAHTPKLMLDWRGLNFGHFHFARAFLAAETPRWAAERTASEAAPTGQGQTTGDLPDDEQEAYLIAFSATSGKSIAILRQFKPAGDRPLVIDTTVASIKTRYPFVLDNGLEGNGSGGNTLILGGPALQMRQCSDQRQFMVPSDSFQEQRLYGIAGFDPQAIHEPSDFDDAREALMAARFNSSVPEAPPAVEPGWVQVHCGPVLAVSVTPRLDDPSLVLLLTFHLYDIRLADRNLHELAERMRQGEAAFLRANADNKPPL